MNVRDLTPVELAGLLDAAYRADQGDPVDAPDPLTRVALADRLGCDEDLRAAVWEAWRFELDLTGRNADEAEYWLDVEFTEPCPEDWPTED